MNKKSVFNTLRFTFFTIFSLGSICFAVATTILNMYEPVVKAYLQGEFIGYFSSEQQFDEVFNDLVAEKQQIDSNVKVYLENEPTFEESYVISHAIGEQNVYTNLRAALKTEFTVYNVAVNGEVKMTFNTQDEANKYSEQLKTEVSKLTVEVKPEKVEQLGEMTSIDRANSILKEIVDRNKPVEVPVVTPPPAPKKTTNAKTKSNKNTKAKVNNNNPPAPVGGTGGVWPTVERRINCAYMGYAGHTGIDIGGAVGTDIYAYKSGTVTFSGWNSYGYGNFVRIDHGNGISTCYAHCSKLLVSSGQRVSQGQVIAKIGLTGNTTGPHLHFEVRINNVPVNPYSYIAGK